MRWGARVRRLERAARSRTVRRPAAVSQEDSFIARVLGCPDAHAALLDAEEREHALRTQGREPTAEDEAFIAAALARAEAALAAMENVPASAGARGRG